LKEYDVIIMGSGPAGLTAAIYAGRALLKTLVIEGQPSGGQLMSTTEVENFPGFAKGILGPHLIQEMTLQARRFDVEFLGQNVDEVDFKSRPFTVTAGDRSYAAKTVIVATGSSAKWIGLPSEKKLLGRGVSGCATCDGFFFKDKRVAVVGGGDTAVEEALFLSRYAKTVTIIHRRNRLRASRIMQSRAFANGKINVMWNEVVEEILGDNKVTGVILRNVETDQRTVIGCDGVFVAIGYEPNTKMLRGQLALDVKGYVVAEEGSRTSVDGVFVAGDVHDFTYRQAITAAGDGCRAALDAIAYLDDQKSKDVGGKARF
jgi:thioredoxin reductase (NADPH)